MFTFRVPIYYNKLQIDSREGIRNESHVPGVRILDGDICSYVFLGGMKDASLLFFGQTIFFVFLSYLNLTERMYIYIFGAYLTVFFAGFTYYSIFIMTPGGGTH